MEKIEEKMPVGPMPTALKFIATRNTGILSVFVRQMIFLRRFLDSFVQFPGNFYFFVFFRAGRQTPPLNSGFIWIQLSKLKSR
jgi:hypothetical protein